MRVFCLLALLWLLGQAAACTTPPTRAAQAPGATQPPGLPDAFSTVGETARIERWWEAFEDPVLDRLVERALSGNFSLKSAVARVVQATALARRSGAPLRPQLSGLASAGGIASRRDTSTGTETDSSDELSAGLSAAWEIDLWGRLRALRGAAVADARAARSDLEAARISLSALVATTWYRYTEEAAIAARLREQMATNEQLRSLVEDRFQRGRGAAADVLRQQQLMERTRGDLALTESRRAVLAHQLAALQGLAAHEVPPPAPPGLVDPPPLPAPGIPSETLNRRPDVRAAWWRVCAADRDLAAAIADQYPNLSLSASATLGGAGLEVFFLDRLARIAADLTAPLLDGGRRRAQIEADAAARGELVHAYSEALIVALREVEDALVQEARERQYLESLERQHELARRVVESLLTRHGHGDAPYLDVLAAVQSEQALAISLVTSKRQVIEHRIELCRAIAGPWKAPPCAKGTDALPPPPDAGVPHGSADAR